MNKVRFANIGINKEKRELIVLIIARRDVNYSMIEGYATKSLKSNKAAIDYVLSTGAIAIFNHGVKNSYPYPGKDCHMYECQYTI